MSRLLAGLSWRRLLAAAAAAAGRRGGTGPPAPVSARASTPLAQASAAPVGGGRRSSCWSCGQALPRPASASAPCPCPLRFCPACRALQPPPPETRQDFFRLLGCPRSFRLDAAHLQQRFRDLQRELHPDYFSQRPQVERDFSEQHSSLVNKAYRTLLSPLSRGLYLLELSGIELEPGTDAKADPGFLSEIMEINEKLLEANSDAKIEEMEKFIADKKEELTTGVSKAFDEGDLQEAKTLLAKMKYFANLEEKVKGKKIPS